MADTAVRASSSNSAATGTALSVTAPTGTTTGDLVVVICHANGQTTLVDNNGSTPFAADLSNFQPNTTSGMTVSVFSRRIQAGDPGTYNFTSGATDRWGVVAITLSSPDPSTIYDVAIGTASTDAPPQATIATIPSVTTLTDKDVHLAVGCADGAGTPLTSDPAGYTPQQSTSNQGIRVASKVITPAGATGSLTMNCTAADAVIGLSIAIKNNTPVSGVVSSTVGPFHGGGPGVGPRMRRMFPQQFPTPGPVDTATPVPTSTPFRIGRAGTSGMPTRRMFPQQAPDTIPFVQDGSAVQTPFRIGRGGGIGAPTRRMFPQLYPDSSAITTTLAPSEGSIVIAGAAASITLVIAAIAGAIVIAGNAPSITTSLQATEGAIVISGNAASTTTILAASAGTVIIGGSAPSLSRTFAATDGAIVIGGNAPSIGAATFSPTEGAITIDGNAPSITLTIPAAPIAVPSGGYAGVRGAKLEWREWETLKKKRKEVERKAPQVARIIEEIAEQNFDVAPALKALSQQLDEENLRQAKIYRELMKLEIERNRFTAQLSEDDDEEAITLLLNG